MWNVRGAQKSEVAARLSAEYGVSEKAIYKDMNRVDSWLPKLADSSFADATSRLKELRAERQRLHRMASEARRDGNTKLERKLRNDILDAIALDVELSQSVGETIEAAQEHEHNVHGAIDVNANPGEQYLQMLDETRDIREELAGAARENDGDGPVFSEINAGPEGVEVETVEAVESPDGGPELELLPPADEIDDRETDATENGTDPTENGGG